MKTNQYNLYSKRDFVSTAHIIRLTVGRLAEALKIWVRSLRATELSRDPKKGLQFLWLEGCVKTLSNSGLVMDYW